MSLLVCLALLGFCFALRRTTQLPIEFTPFFVISSCIVLLYLFAYVNLLETGVNALLLTGGILLLCSPLYLKQERVFEKYMTPGFVIALSFLALYLTLAQFTHLTEWDEFTHWGPHAKLVLLHNGFLKASDVTDHKSYPLGGALFQYLFLHVTGFHEGTTYFAQCLLIMAPLSIFVINRGWQNWKFTLIAYALTLLILVVLHIQIGLNVTLYMDCVTGIYFGMIMVTFLSMPKHIGTILYLIPPVMVMTLFKQKLIPLILMASFIIFIDYYVIGGHEKKERYATIKMLLCIMLLPLASYAMTQSWHHYLAIAGIPIEWKMHLTLTKIFSALMAKSGSVPHNIIINFCSALKRLSASLIVILAVNAVLYFLSTDRKSKLLIGAVTISFLCGLIAYLFGLLLMYLFSFSTYEGIHHASMSRYIGIYYMGWYLVTLYFARDVFKHYTLKKYQENILIVLIVAAFSLVFIFHHHHTKIEAIRKPITRIADAVKKVTPQNAKILSIWQNSEGLEVGILKYELVPRKPSQTCNSVGKPYNANDIWTCQLTRTQFEKQVSHFDYLLLAYVDNNFWSHYGVLIPNRRALIRYTICTKPGFNTFETAKCTMHQKHVYLFKITVTQDGKIQLHNVVKP